MDADAVVLDTDIVSLLLYGTLPSGMQEHIVNKYLCITFVTIGELWQGAIKANWSESRRKRLQDYLQKKYVVLPYDGRVAYVWGHLSGTARRRRRPPKIPVNDYWIAATCLTRELPLVTRNTKDFERIGRLTLLGPQPVRSLRPR
jgi:predicted nucleic acid-binding protein